MACRMSMREEPASADAATEDADGVLNFAEHKEVVPNQVCNVPQFRLNASNTTRAASQYTCYVRRSRVR